MCATGECVSQPSERLPSWSAQPKSRCHRHGGTHFFFCISFLSLRNLLRGVADSVQCWLTPSIRIIDPPCFGCASRDMLLVASCTLTCHSSHAFWGFDTDVFVRSTSVTIPRTLPTYTLLRESGNYIGYTHRQSSGHPAGDRNFDDQSADSRSYFPTRFIFFTISRHGIDMFTPLSSSQTR